MLFSACAPGVETLNDAEADLDSLRGRNALAQNEYAWARHYFAADLEANPRRVESWRGLGVASLRSSEGSASGAIEAFSRALELEERDDLRRWLARAHLARGEAVEAFAVLAPLPMSAETGPLQARAASAFDPEAASAALTAYAMIEPPDENLDVLALAAEVHAQNNDLDAALVAADLLLRRDPFRAEIAYQRAGWLRRVERSQDADDALRIYEIAASSTVDDAVLDELIALTDSADAAPVLLRRAQMRLAGSGLDDEADDLVGRLCNHPDAVAGETLALARTAIRQGRPWLARKLYECLLERDPSQVGANLAAADLALRDGDLESAARYLVVLQEHEDDASTLFLAGRLALAEGREAEALASLRRAAELAPWDEVIGRLRDDVEAVGGVE